MYSLKEGVLLQLLADIKTAAADDPPSPPPEDSVADDTKPALLQIRSIIPVLEDGDLFPNRGFFLKVSDQSHALYVSLSDEQNEMILANKLKLGQFIHVSNLQKSHPAPLLRGVTPIPGRRRCEGTPQDIVPQPNLARLLEASAVDSVVEKGVILEKKISRKSTVHNHNNNNSSDSETPSSYCSSKGVVRPRSLSASKTRRNKWDSEKSCYNNVDNDSDVDSFSAHRRIISKRRSWNESEIIGAKEIFDSSVVKHEIKLPPRSRSANASPVRSVRYDSSDDNSSMISRRRNVSSPQRMTKSCNKSQLDPPSKANDVEISNPLCGLVYERKGVETGISWSSLPSNLVKFGKEVVRQRDVALLAAADALQEACASERLLNSLSTLSQFPLAEGDDLQPHVDKFFDLQEDLARTRLIMQSLTSITPFRNEETESCNTNSIKETLTLALERKKNAIKWIKSAVAQDLSLSSFQVGPTIINPVVPTKTSPSKPKGACIVKTKKRSSNNNTDNNNNTRLILASEKENSRLEWSKGSTLSSGAELAASLQEEYRKLFLSYVEKYLDEVDRKSSLMECDDREVAVMMYKVKMVSDWLNVIVHKTGCDGSDFEEPGGGSAYGRVRDKIYGILLNHVERTALANFDRD